MKSKIKHTVLLVRVGLIVAAISIILFIYLMAIFNWRTISFCVLLLIPIIYNLIIVTRLKEIDLQKDKIKIYHIFKFKSETYSLDDISEILKRSVKDETKTGPGHIDFPSLEVTIKFNNGKDFKFNSRENLKLEEIFDQLKNKTPMENKKRIE